jgi:hypothetical protein
MLARVVLSACRSLVARCCNLLETIVSGDKFQYFRQTGSRGGEGTMIDKPEDDLAEFDKIICKTSKHLQSLEL